MSILHDELIRRHRETCVQTVHHLNNGDTESMAFACGKALGYWEALEMLHGGARFIRDQRIKAKVRAGDPGGGR